MNLPSSVRYIGVNDHDIDLFEGQFTVPNGMAYNSYLILDDKIAVMDSVGGDFATPWFAAMEAALDGRTPDYLVVQHMEPDHSANIAAFMERYPSATLVSSAQAFRMMKAYFGTEWTERRIVVKEGDTLPLGTRTLSFIAAPMVHWPEVIMTYSAHDKILFSADGFGKFGALDVEEDWACEARRYYFGIVGKFGAQVQAVLKKAAALEIATICPLHGPILSGDLTPYLSLYNTWSSYQPESEGVLIAYTSVYGHTREAVELLADTLKAKGCPKVVVTDLARDDMAEAIEDAFRYGKIVLATTTYNTGIFPYMHTFLTHLTEHAYQNRTIGLIENGSWAPAAAKTMRALLANSPKITFTNTTVTLRAALDDTSRAAIDALATELI